MEKVATEATQERNPAAAADTGEGPSRPTDAAPADNHDAEDVGDMSQFEDLFEQSLQTFQEGEVLEGKVVRVDKEFVLVDVGYKSEGQIPVREFAGPDGTVDVQPGDTVEVLLERWDPEEGMIRLSRSKALRRKVWKEIVAAYEAEAPIKGTVVARIKGGLSVRIGEGRGGVTAFLPYSQIDIRPVRDPESFIDQEVECAILKCNQRRENVVVSRRTLLEKDRAEKRAKTLAELAEGQVREGVVKNITDYGAFVDLGGIDGLLHITDMSWGRVEHPSKVFKVGDTIQVKVLSFDPETEKVSLGTKQLAEDPWLRVEEKYPVGTTVEGTVVSLTDYGAFVELEEGVEGLIHVSEMSWTKRVRHPSQVVNVGDRIQAAVLKVDPEAKRISLSLKQVTGNPWEEVQERYPAGTVIEGTVKNVTDFGVFIGIQEGIDGLVHISDLSWSKRVKHPGELYKKGDAIRAVVLNVDKERERFSLGVKQLQPDPWESVPEKFPAGSVVTGKVTNVTEFGVFVELEEGVEGLIHVSELGPGKVKTPVGMFEEGQEVTAKVIHV
ncbi:30S ribosomal protein S1, partial [Dissulfurirhabdus thermomarina]|nr:30S ribosomal protein S1 [Dissulfurirhabdus thermomarina]